MPTKSKVILLGSAAVGKSCLIHRYKEKTYVVCSATTVIDIHTEKEEVGGKSIDLEIWDTCGQERFDALNHMYYRHAEAAIVCYDITNGPSFDNACYWLMELTRLQTLDCKVFLCGTKKDLVDDNAELRTVPLETIRKISYEYQAAVFEVSSKTGEQVDQLFKSVAEYCIQKQNVELTTKQKDTNTVQLTPQNGQPVENGGCGC